MYNAIFRLACVALLCHGQCTPTVNEGLHSTISRAETESPLRAAGTIAALPSSDAETPKQSIRLSSMRVLAPLLLAFSPAVTSTQRCSGKHGRMVYPAAQSLSEVFGGREVLGRRIPLISMSDAASSVLDADSEASSEDKQVDSISDKTAGRFSEVKKALVAGATGGTGRAIVDRLLAEGVAVRALVRDASKASLPAGVEMVEGDVYEYGTLTSVVEGCDVVLCATGNRPDLSDPLGPFKVDYIGTGNLAAAARNAGVKNFVFVSSIAADELLYPLNLAFGVLFWKKRGEEALQRSGVKYTIVRPGGLKNDGQSLPIVMERANTFGLPPARRQAGSILRTQVADLCVEALVTPAASNKIVEVIAVEGAQEKLPEELYAAVP